MAPATNRRQRTAKPLSIKQRQALATTQITQLISATNTNAVVAAALELVAEYLTWDSIFKNRMLTHYEELEELAPTPKDSPPRAPLPMPIAKVGLDRINPYGSLDPYLMLEGYGANQLRAVMEHSSVAKLREAVDVVQARNPGTKPANRTKKGAMIDYIVENVAGPDY